MYGTECHTNALTTFLFGARGFGGLMEYFLWVLGDSALALVFWP